MKFLLLLNFFINIQLFNAPYIEELDENILIQEITWAIDGIAFITTDKDYTLKPISAIPSHHRFGNFVEFSADGSFKGYYTAPCGVDCFTSVYGTYTLKNQEVRIFIEKVDRNGFCEGYDDKVLKIKNREMGTFQISGLENESLSLKHTK